MKRILFLFLALMMGVAATTSCTPGSSSLKMDDLPLVFENEDVVIHALDEHTWVGNGRLVYNETIYIVEGEEKALLIDSGMRIDHLDEIVASITDKPVTLVLTHNHADHNGSVKWFDELWVGDQGGKQKFRGFKGKVNYLTEHQQFDLGGRAIEVFNAPGHTAESVIFIDKASHYAFSGDAFGSTSLLMTQDVSTFIKTAENTLEMMEEQGIDFMYPGHYGGDNPETVECINALLAIANDVLSGKVEGERKYTGLVLNRIVTRDGVNFNYSSRKVR